MLDGRSAIVDGNVEGSLEPFCEAFDLFPDSQTGLSEAPFEDGHLVFAWIFPILQSPQPLYTLTQIVKLRKRIWRKKLEVLPRNIELIIFAIDPQRIGSQKKYLAFLLLFQLPVYDINFGVGFVKQRIALRSKPKIVPEPKARLLTFEFFLIQLDLFQVRTIAQSRSEIRAQNSKKSYRSGYGRLEIFCDVVRAMRGVQKTREHLVQALKDCLIGQHACQIGQSFLGCLGGCA